MPKVRYPGLAGAVLSIATEVAPKLVPDLIKSIPAKQPLSRFTGWFLAQDPEENLGRTIFNSPMNDRSNRYSGQLPDAISGLYKEPAIGQALYLTEADPRDGLNSGSFAEMDHYVNPELVPLYPISVYDPRNLSAGAKTMQVQNVLSAFVFETQKPMDIVDLTFTVDGKMNPLLIKVWQELSLAEPQLLVEAGYTSMAQAMMNPDDCSVPRALSLALTPYGEGLSADSIRGPNSASSVMLWGDPFKPVNDLNAVHRLTIIRDPSTGQLISRLTPEDTLYNEELGTADQDMTAFLEEMKKDVEALSPQMNWQLFESQYTAGAYREVMNAIGSDPDQVMTRTSAELYNQLVQMGFEENVGLTMFNGIGDIIVQSLPGYGDLPLTSRADRTAVIDAVIFKPVQENAVQQGYVEQIGRSSIATIRSHAVAQQVSTIQASITKIKNTLSATNSEAKAKQAEAVEIQEKIDKSSGVEKAALIKEQEQMKKDHESLVEKAKELNKEIETLSTDNIQKQADQRAEDTAAKAEAEKTREAGKDIFDHMVVANYAIKRRAQKNLLAVLNNTQIKNESSYDKLFGVTGSQFVANRPYKNIKDVKSVDGLNPTQVQKMIKQAKQCNVVDIIIENADVK